MINANRISIFWFKRSVSIVLVGLLIAVQVQPAAVVRADPIAEFFAVPSTVMRGASVIFTGYDFTPSSAVELYLMTTPSQYLGGFSTDAAGRFSGSVVLPDVSAGDYEVMASPNDVFASLTALPALTVDLLPNSGPPGTVVHFTINNLLEGQLRLDYAGFPVFGPVDVSAGTFEGDFLVPGDRPSPLGIDAELLAVNLLGNQVQGTVSTFFVSQEPNPNAYTITNVQLPDTPVPPGSSFTLSGQISPPPIGPLSSYDLKILWKSADGKIIPITQGHPTLLANGSFTAGARVPSLLAGDALIPESGGQVGIAFLDLHNGASAEVSSVAWGLDPPPPVFTVKVVNPSGDPIPGAIVDIRAFYSNMKSLSGQTATGAVLNNQLSNLEVHENQIVDYLGPLTTSQSDSFTCDFTNVYGKTNLQGEFTVQFDPVQMAMMGEKIFLGNLPKPTYGEVPMEITFPLYVNALHVGYGHNNLAQVYKTSMRFSGYSNLFYDAQTNQLLNTNPFIVTLTPLPAGTNIPLPIVPKIGLPGLLTATNIVVGSKENYLGTGIPMIAFGNFYSFPLAQFPKAWFIAPPPNIEIEFQHDPAVFGALDPANIKFTLAGQTYPFVLIGKKYEGSTLCKGEVYRASIPNLHRFAPGFYTGMIELHDMSLPANITRYYVQLNIVPAPTWILDPKYQLKQISPPQFLDLSWILKGYQYPSGDPDSLSSLDTNVNKVGPLSNRVSYQDEVSQQIFPDKTSGIKYSGVNATTTLSKGADSQNLSGNVAGGKEILIPKTTLTVLDTGKMPLYRHVFGIPPIAGATLGADMWFNATLSKEGVIQFTPSGGTSTTLDITPTAKVGVDAFFDLSVIFGLVSANAHAVPDITLKMPTRFVNGGLQDSQKCFLYNLDVEWEASAGVCPFCLSKSGTEGIFHGSNPNPCTISTSQLVQNSPTLTAITPAPPTASPALAVDGYGHTLLVWSDLNGNIQSQVFSGGQLTANQQVSAGSASSDPQVAFYAPNKAVAVWTENSLTLTQAQTATLDQLIQAQHLKFATWDGSGWSVPQNLTLPTDSNGEGRVALAGCLSTNPACPLGGAVTVVWVRDAVGSLAARQFRLYYASYAGSAWSAPQAIDTTSTATDAEPNVAYRIDGTAVVAWVRDGDRSLATLNDRQIAQRQLIPGSPVIVESSLPSGAAEPSLAINSAGELLLAYTVATDPLAFIGDQRQLHAAQRTCGGQGCAWNDQALTDANGRPVHAESPTLILNGSGQAQIAYRALGFGPAYPGAPTVLKGDALGTILGTGELAQASVSFSNNIITPSYKTNAGKTIWQTAAVYDPLLNQVYAVGSQGSGPSLPSVLANQLESLGYQVADLTAATESLTFVTSSSASDFSIFEVTPSTLFPQEGGVPLSIFVMVMNNGPEFSGRLQLMLAWDAPVGLGTPAGEYMLTTIAAGSLTGVEFSTDSDTLTLPAFPHLPHTLYVQVNPLQNPAESDYANNLQTVMFGGLPAPQGLAGVAQSGDSSVFLRWLPVEHLDVKGYRIYRSSDGRTYEPVGSSFGTGFVDLSAVQGNSYLYTVVAYAGDGSESPMSESVTAVVNEIHLVYLPSIRR